MKVRFAMLGLAVSACLAGCKTCLENRMPSCDGLTDEMRTACVKKPRCYITYELKSIEPQGVIFPKFLYARMKKDTLEREQKNILIDLMQRSCLFADIIEGDRVMEENAMSVNVSTWIDKPTGHADRYDFTFLFDVIDEGGVRHQYRMGESVLNNTFGGNTAPGLIKMFEELHRKTVNTLLVSMYNDGLFGGEKTPAQGKTNVRETILADERKKNLDSLLKAGVITEEEYKKEIGKKAK